MDVICGIYVRDGYFWADFYGENKKHLLRNEMKESNLKFGKPSESITNISGELRN